MRWIMDQEGRIPLNFNTKKHGKVLVPILHKRLWRDILNNIFIYLFFLVRTKDTQIQQTVLQQAGEIPHAVCLGDEVGQRRQATEQNAFTVCIRSFHFEHFCVPHYFEYTSTSKNANVFIFINTLSSPETSLTQDNLARQLIIDWSHDMCMTRAGPGSQRVLGKSKSKL